MNFTPVRAASSREPGPGAAVRERASIAFGSRHEPKHAAGQFIAHLRQALAQQG